MPGFVGLRLVLPCRPRFKRRDVARRGPVAHRVGDARGLVVGAVARAEELVKGLRAQAVLPEQLRWVDGVPPEVLPKSLAGAPAACAAGRRQLQRDGRPRRAARGRHSPPIHAGTVEVSEGPGTKRV